MDPGGATLEVTVDERPDGLRVTAVRRDGGPPRRSAPSADGAHGDRPHRVDLAEVVPGWYSLVIDGRSHTLGVATWRSGAAGPPHAGAGPRRWTLLLDGVAVAADAGRSPRVRSAAQGPAGTAIQVRAPMPGLVVAIQAEPGTAVMPGQPLIIMEAMKMQMEIRAPHAGVVREVRVVPGQDVAGNDLLATVE